MEKLSIIIPCFNEEETLETILQKVIEVKIPFDKEIVIVDDCSTDNSVTIIKNYKAPSDIDIKKLFHKKNKGKGAAVKTGIENCSGNYIIIQDADLELYPEDYNLLIEYMLKHNSQVVFGTRMINYDISETYKFSIFIASLMVNFIFNVLFKTTLTDVMCGYKLIKREALKNIEIKSKGFDFEVEISAKLIKKGIHIKEVPIRYAPRNFMEGKKIRWIDSLKIFKSLIINRFAR